MWGHSERVFPKPFPEIRNLHFRFGGMSISLYAQMRENANPRPEARLSFAWQPNLRPVIWMARHWSLPNSVPTWIWALTKPQSSEPELRQGCTCGRHYARTSPKRVISLEPLFGFWSSTRPSEVSQNTLSELSKRTGRAKWLDTAKRIPREAEWDYAIPPPPQSRGPPRALVSSASIGVHLILDWGCGG